MVGTVIGNRNRDRNRNCRPISTAVRQPQSTPGFSPPSRACRGRTARSSPVRSARTQIPTAHASKRSQARRPVQAVSFSSPVSERPRRLPWFRLHRHAGCASPPRNVSAEPSTRPKPPPAPLAKLKVSTPNPYYLRPTSMIVPPSTIRAVFAREASSARAKQSPATTRARRLSPPWLRRRRSQLRRAHLRPRPRPHCRCVSVCAARSRRPSGL